jgi:uncharacterized protein (TIGR02284 family)
MAETIHDFSAAIDKLITINRDAEQGFRAAADAVPDETLKRMFVDLSVERAKFASEIQECVRTLGFEPTNPLGTAGTLHGVWISLKGAVLDNKAHAVLEETEHGEYQSLQVYRQAQSMILQAELRSIVDRQLAAIQQSHDRILTMRDESAPAPSPAPAPSAAPAPSPAPAAVGKA